MSETEASFDDTHTVVGTWNKSLSVKAIDLIFRALKESYGKEREFCFRSPPADWPDDHTQFVFYMIEGEL